MWLSRKKRVSEVPITKAPKVSKTSRTLARIATLETSAVTAASPALAFASGVSSMRRAAARRSDRQGGMWPM